MKFARYLLIFSYGLFTIAAQTLLFREFITAFEGNDISVGLFFASWFLWVGLGAVLIYRAERIAEKLLKNIELLFLAYLPAFILELVLIIQARQLLGIESYTLLPIRTILFLSILVNAPLSIITGMLFPILCRWLGSNQKLPVSRVYILEAVGSFTGGLGVTVLLAIGISLAKIFLLLALILSLAASAVQLTKIKQRLKLRTGPKLIFVLPIVVCLCLVFSVDKTLMNYIHLVKWTKLLPKDSLAGSFQTAQAEYLYGTYQGQWIAVREASICEALPDEATAGQIAAVTLCQNPEAKNILVIGSGLGLCREFLRLEQTDNITWTHSDNEYVQRVEQFIPTELKITDKRLHRFAGDVRSALAQKKQNYDIVILNLPDATSSVLNRYYTLEFYRQIKDSLNPNGLLAIRIAGGENIMGTELINLGASTKLTLEKVFSQLVLTPGEDTWFIASDSTNLTGNPGTLKDRFAAIPSAADIFKPEALLSVYLPDRADFALANYASADLPPRLLINRDWRPLTHLYSLLLAAKQSGAPSAKLAKHLALAGIPAFLIPIVIFIALSLFYLLKTTGDGNASGFDSTFLVFSAGSIGIGAVIVLMYLYQTRFGSLYLHIGVISSLFMAGLTAAAILIRYLAANHQRIHPKTLLFSVMLLHILILTAISFWPLEQFIQLVFAIAFVSCGLCAGCYFPLAAAQLKDSGFETGRAGSKLESADHLGASVGGLLTGLVLVPVLGTRQTLFVFIFLIAANAHLAIIRLIKPEKFLYLDTSVFKLRRLGYILFGIGLSIILCSNLLAAAGMQLSPSLPQSTAQALAGQSNIEKISASFDNTNRRINYFKVHQAEESPAGYIFSSQDLASEVRGFGGRMNVAIYVDATGKLINFHIIRSNETPSYLRLLSKWYQSLKSRQLFEPEPFTDIHAVTGATVSSNAVLSALQSSSHKFAIEILGQSLTVDTKAKVHRASYLPDKNGVYLISAVILTLIVIYRGGFWSRLAVLAFNLVIGGLILNAQYSTEQIATALSLHSPAAGLSGTFLLTIGVPLMVILCGNIYCGYICPFGAAQELIGFVLPRKFKQAPSREKMQKARFVKYTVLFVLIIVFFLSRNRTTLASDPLIEIFNFRFAIYDLQTLMLWIVAIALVGSLVFTRFWCRYLCPAGAFLSLLNNVAILKRYLPAKRFGRCEFGLTPKDKTDCLYCDKCRYDPKVISTKTKLIPARYFLIGVLIVAFSVSAVSIDRFLEVMPAGFDQADISLTSGGQPRDVDLQRIEKMIEEGKLSEQEAQYYKKVE